MMLQTLSSRCSGSSVLVWYDAAPSMNAKLSPYPRPLEDGKVGVVGQGIVDGTHRRVADRMCRRSREQLDQLLALLTRFEHDRRSSSPAGFEVDYETDLLQSRPVRGERAGA